MTKLSATYRRIPFYRSRKGYWVFDEPTTMHVPWDWFATDSDRAALRPGSQVPESEQVQMMHGIIDRMYRRQVTL